MNPFYWALCAFLVFNAAVCTNMVGKPRAPITGRAAFTVTSINAAIIIGILISEGVCK